MIWHTNIGNCQISNRNFSWYQFSKNPKTWFIELELTNQTWITQSISPPQQIRINMDNMGFFANRLHMSRMGQASSPDSSMVRWLDDVFRGIFSKQSPEPPRKTWLIPIKYQLVRLTGAFFDTFYVCTDCRVAGVKHAMASNCWPIPGII